MAIHHNPSVTRLVTFSVLLFLIPRSYSAENNASQASEKDYLEFAQNIAYLKAEFFLIAALGRGLDAVDPGLAEGGPPPIGGRRAALDSLTRDIFTQIGYIEVDDLRVTKRTIGYGIPRPLLNISKEVFAEFMNEAFERRLIPAFDPYANSINSLLAAYVMPYVALNGLVGLSPQLQNVTHKKLVAGVLGITAGQDAVIRTLLYERKNYMVNPYRYTVEEFTNRISNLRNKLGNTGIKDEGLVVPPSQGAAGRVSGNVLSADNDSLSYPRSIPELLRILQDTTNASVPGAFFPNGTNGRLTQLIISGQL